MFCQDCGRRLAAAGGSAASPAEGFDAQERFEAPATAVVAPTPPVGLAGTMVALGGDLAGREGGPAGARSISRPEAPSFSFGPREEAELEPVCPACSRKSPRGNLFCFACGTRLAEPATSAVGAVLPDDTAPAAGSPAPTPAATAATVAPAGPTAFGAPEPGPERPERGPSQPSTSIACPRCGGICEGAMSFCKFCGARLRAAASAPPAPGPAGRASMRPVAPSANAAPASVSSGIAARPAGLASRPPAPIEPVATTTTGQLVTIARDGAQGASYPLTGDQVDLGREEGHIVLPGDGYLSPRHMRLLLRGGRWYARDLGSTNGVFLRLRRPHRLLDGDLLLLGLEVVRFEVVKDTEQGLGPAMEHGTLLFGSPLLPRRARLCQRTVEGVTRNVYYLTRDETIIGRESGDVVFSDDLFMSRRHLAIRRDAATGDFIAEDLGASNGTFVAIREEMALADGDFLRVGQHLFRLDLNPERT